MFCSNCGKSLKPDAANCPHCGAVVGESRFDGHPYTGAQIRIRPGEAVRLPGNHTKTTYMGSEPDDNGDVETRTTYRATNEGAAPLYSAPEQEPLFNAEDDLYGAEEEPVYDAPEEDEPENIPESEPEAPEETPEADELPPEEEPEDFDDDYDDEEEEDRLRAERKAARKARRAEKRAKREAEREAEDEAEFGDFDGDEEDDLSDLKPRDIEIEKRAGISEDVSRYMTELRSAYEEKTKTQEARQQKKKPSRFSLKKSKKETPEDDDDFNISDTLDDKPAENAPQAEEYDPDEEAQYIADDSDLEFESENPEPTDDGFEEFTNENFADDEALKRRQKVFTYLKYVIAAGIIVAVIVGVTTLLSNIAHDNQRAQIPNVTTTLYSEGVELMQYRVGDDYIKSMLGIYNANNSSTLVAFSEAMSKDLDSIKDLLPAEPDLNDQRFVSALTAIQEDINNCLTNDVLSLSDAEKTNDVKQSESDARWTIVRSKVSALAGATDKAQLDAIIKGERIEVIQQTTPEPVATQTPVPYSTLSKGSTGSAVIELQTRLTALGYMDSEIDGDFGNKTKTAVQLFQKAAGIETTGIADVNTQLALFAADAPMYTK